MEMTGEQRIPAPRQTVWEALNDPEVLKQCIPGCEEIEKTSDTEFAAKVRAKVGPVSARFAGTVKLSDLDPPNGYTISGEGKGGAAGFAKGGAKVELEDQGDATLLRYHARAQVGGKLAQLGSRLIDGTARKMSEDFFTRFSQVVGGVEAAPAAEPEVRPEAPPAAAAAEGAPEAEAEAHAQPEPVPDRNVGAGARVGVWVTAILIIVLILLAIFAL